MQRHELEHIIRAASTITEMKNLIIIGSQAILGSVPNPPGIFTVSMEADIYPEDDPKLAELIEGCIGELSPFHENFGYYAQGVGPETAILAKNWRSRCVEVYNDNTSGARGFCLSLIDLAISKILANREKDNEFVKNMFDYNLIKKADILAVTTNELEYSKVSKVNEWLKRIK